VIAAIVFEGNTAVSDGKHIIYGMLITALVFLAVVGLGELSRWAGYRRQAKKQRARVY
jgi:hypothetical protein